MKLYRRLCWRWLTRHRRGYVRCVVNTADYDPEWLAQFRLPESEEER